MNASNFEQAKAWQLAILILIRPHRSGDDHVGSRRPPARMRPETIRRSRLRRPDGRLRSAGRQTFCAGRDWPAFGSFKDQPAQGCFAGARSPGTCSGSWAETTRHVGGNIDGVARGNHIQVRVSGTLSALLAMSTSANRQSISIQAPGSEMASVAISLARR